MALPTTGQITMDQMADEVYGVNGKTTDQSLGAMSDIAQKTAPDQMSDFYNYSQLKQGLVAYWAMEDSETITSMTDSHGSYNGTVTGGPKSETGINGQCFRFSDGDESIVSNLQSTTRTDWSVSTWVKVNIQIDSSNERIWNWANNYFNINCLTTNYLVIWDGGTNNTSFQLTNTDFSHIVVTNNSSGWKCYFNGGTPQTGTSQTVSGNFYINTSSSQVDDGSYYIDETAYWTRTLTTEDVARLYNSGTGLFYSSF